MRKYKLKQDILFALIYYIFNHCFVTKMVICMEKCIFTQVQNYFVVIVVVVEVV